jgi:U3 small nucleolar RNA-associated protein 21
MYNLQSGQHRRRFPVRLTPAEAKKYKLLQLQAEEADDEETLEGPRKFAKGEGKHKGAVTGLTVDGLNRTVISCSDDGKVKVTIPTSVEV